MHVCVLYIYFCCSDPREKQEKLYREWIFTECDSRQSGMRWEAGAVLPSVALGKVACAGSRWQLAGAVLPSVALGKELTEPADVKSLYFAERHCLALGKLFAECPCPDSRRIPVCLRGARRVAFAECNSRQRRCQRLLVFCRVSVALGVYVESSSDVTIIERGEFKKSEN